MSERPLCVDLDGTLIHTESLVLSLWQLIGSRPLYCVALPFWLLGGMANFKQKVADHTDLNLDRVPFNNELLAFLRSEKSRGRPLVLATGANQRVAKKFADHLQIFDKIYASDAKVNLSGRNKAFKLVEEFGRGNFDYVGNSVKDLAVWQHAHEALLVNTCRTVEKRARRVANVARVF